MRAGLTTDRRQVVEPSSTQCLERKTIEPHLTGPDISIRNLVARDPLQVAAGNRSITLVPARAVFFREVTTQDESEKHKCDRNCAQRSRHNNILIKAHCALNRYVSVNVPAWRR